ncbi:hypothetical protein FACUT_13135 [Fusarium acutatum]|uniref:Uncharacterized protein n=1 Tax=Fusarium acutatum TaxID=78861 RepID=A0A8H4J9T8_9HYPO|nr:hypothetical protein FACUT_13135 [Fusarium acutatum]
MFFCGLNRFSALLQNFKPCTQEDTTEMTESTPNKLHTSQKSPTSNRNTEEAGTTMKARADQCNPCIGNGPNAPPRGCAVPLSPSNDRGFQDLSLEDIEDEDHDDDIQPGDQESIASVWLQTLRHEIGTYAFAMFRYWKDKMGGIAPSEDGLHSPEPFGSSSVKPMIHTRADDEHDISHEELSSISRPIHSISSLHLACPFYVFDPEKCEQCLLEDDIQSSEDLLDHLFRCHPRLSYCPNCYETFGNLICRDDHVLRVKCRRRDPGPLFGLSEKQKMLLTEIDATQDINQEAVWFQIWSIVFPATPEPRSPYLDRDPGLCISMMRDFWSSNGLEYVAQSLEDRGILPDDSRSPIGILHELIQEDLLNGIIDEQRCSRKSSLRPG